jgi:hypothetical protein
MKKYTPVIIIGLILVTAFTLVLLGTFVVQKFLENRLKSQTFGTYSMQSREVRTNLLLRQITVRNINIKNIHTPEMFNIDEIKATGIRILPFIFNNNLIIGTLVISHPEITLIQHNLEDEQEAKEELASKAGTELKLIQINKLEVVKAILFLQTSGDMEADTVFRVNGGLEIWDVTIKNNREQFNFEVHPAQKLSVKLDSGLYKLPGDLYQMKFKSLELDSEKAIMQLTNLQLSTLYPKYEIGRRTKVETDWYDFMLNRIELRGINTEALLKDTAIVFRIAILEELNASIFRDKRPPFPEKPDSKLPMEMLEKLPFPFHTDSILLINSNITYEEIGEESSEPGVVTFNQLYASIYNLSTVNNLIEGQTSMSARAMIMNKALLEAEFVFPNKKFPHQYRASGNLEPIGISAFNPILIPSAFVRIDDGQINRMEFNFTYNNNNSEGILELEYEGLDISLLDKEDGSKKKIKTFIAETFILQSDNLKDKRSYKEGTISFERDKKKSIFNYWWKSLFSGIQDIMSI